MRENRQRERAVNLGFMPQHDHEKTPSDRDRRYTYDGDYDTETRRGNVYNFADYSPHNKHSMIEKGHYSSDMPEAHLTKQEAQEWCSRMRNADGTRGGHWSLEEVLEVMKEKNVDVHPYDFYAVLNMMYSDYCKVAHKFGVNHRDFYIEMAKAFLEDKDAAEEKTVIYYDCIAL